MSKKVVSVDEAAKSFLDEFDQAPNCGPEELDQSKPFTMGASGVVQITPALAAAQALLINVLAKKLGPKHTHEATIQQALWREAHELRAVGECDPSKSQALLDKLKSAKIDDYRFVMPNRLWVLPKSDVQLVVGPVRTVSSAVLLNSEKVISENAQIKIGGEPENEIMLVGGATIIQLESLGPFCWDAKINCAEGNLNEEVRWLADVATSLVRLAAVTADDHAPALGEVELRPFDRLENLSCGIRLTETGFGAGGLRYPARYGFASNIEERTNNPEFVSLAEVVFSQGKKQLSSRMFQALGWLSRARQSADNSERLLGFFTALEALLSNSDKTAPVVETIARRVGVIWSDDANARRQIAERVKRLYGVRSNTVHRGERSALHSEAKEIQKIAEIVCAYVLRSKQLQSPENEFFEVLGAATYGGAWTERPGSKSS